MKANIEKLDYEGRGITHVDGKVWFISHALPNEEVDVSLKSDAKRFAIAEVNTIYKQSEKRMISFCPYSKKCGGCTYDIVRYEDSLNFKKEIIEDLFFKNGINLPEFLIVPSRPVLGYRNKVSLHVKDGLFGYFEEESHQFVPIKACYLINPVIQNLLDDFSIFSFQEGSISIRVNEQEELLINIKTEEELKIKESLVKKHKIVGILWNDLLVYGSSSFLIKQNNLDYQVHALSFFQVNPYVSEKIVQTVLSFFDSSDNVMDLYCGAGFFTLPLALKVDSVVGIEVSKESIMNALTNARLNHITNASFHVGKVEDVLPLLKNDIKNVIVDPPRSGLKKSVISCLIQNRIDKIVYISCNPITLVRDLKLLLNDYEITFFRCYDMFSYTKHVECVCLLKRR